MPVPDEEVVFLVLHYLRSLDAGAQVADATRRLEASLVDARLLPSVCDYTGATRILTYEQCARKHPHIPPSYLPDALAERIPLSPVPINTLLANGIQNTLPSRSLNMLQRKEKAVTYKPSNYSVAAYRRKHSRTLTNTHALLEQMHVLERPLPLRNIVYSVLPKLMTRLKRVVGHHSPVYCASYDFSGDYIITGSDDHQVKVWSSRTGYLCHTLRGHQDVISDITSDPSRRILVSGSRDSSIRLWDLVTGENTHVLHTGSKSVNCVLFSPCPDRPYLLSGGDDGIARLWNTRNFEQTCLTIPIPVPRPNRLAQTVGTSGVARGRTVGDSFPSQSPPGVGAESIPASSPPRTPSRMSPPPAPAPAPQPNEFNSAQAAVANTLVTNTLANAVSEFNTAMNSTTAGGAFNGQSARPLTQGTSQPRAGPSHAGGPSSNPDPRQTGAGPVAGAHIVPPPPIALPPMGPMPMPPTPVSAHSAQNNSVASSTLSSQVLSVAFNKGATRLAISGSDCMTHVYSITQEATHGALPTVRLLTTLRGHSSKITQVLFSHHGDRLCTASFDGTSRIYRRVSARVPNKKRGQTIIPGLGTWKSVVLNCRRTDDPSGSQAAGGAASNSITPRVPRTPRYPSSVDAVLWSLHDDYVITASNDGKVRVWESETGKLARILDAHTREVYIMDTHPFDERVIFTAGYDGKCILWDIESGKELRRLSTDNGIDNANQNALHPSVMDGQFSPDGMSFSVTDTSGALTTFGVYGGDAMLLAPEEQFFANDIVPFRRDAQHRAISQETGQLLHLMPKGDLCDTQLRRHPSEVQVHCRDFYKNLPGARDRYHFNGSVKTEADAKIARGEEFRKNEDREERRLVRAAIDEKKRAMRAREKAELEKDLLIDSPMKDFVISDSEKDSDGDFNLEAVESEGAASSEEENADAAAAAAFSDSSEEVMPRRRRRKARTTRRRRTQTSTASQEKSSSHKEANGIQDDAMAVSDGGSDDSDESFRPESEDGGDSDASDEGPKRSKRKKMLASKAQARDATAENVDPNVRSSTSCLPRMTIHLSRNKVGEAGNADPREDFRRSPGRSLTSEPRADNNDEDKIMPQQPSIVPPPFSRASSSNGARLGSQWSVQSTEGATQAANGPSQNTAVRRRRSPRTRSKASSEDVNEPSMDVDEISRRELEALANEQKMHEQRRGNRKPRGKRGRKKRRSRQADDAGSTIACTADSPNNESEEPHHSESDNSEGSVPIRRKRRKTKNSTCSYAGSHEASNVMAPNPTYVGTSHEASNVMAPNPTYVGTSHEASNVMPPTQPFVGTSHEASNVVAPTPRLPPIRAFASTSRLPGASGHATMSAHAAMSAHAVMSAHAATSGLPMMTGHAATSGFPSVTGHAATSRLPSMTGHAATSGLPSTSGHAAMSGHAATSSLPMPYQENSRNEHSSISIAAASTMSCAGQNANVGRLTENGGRGGGNGV